MTLCHVSHRKNMSTAQKHHTRTAAVHACHDCNRRAVNTACMKWYKPVFFSRLLLTQTFLCHKMQLTQKFCTSNESALAVKQSYKM